MNIIVHQCVQGNLVKLLSGNYLPGDHIFFSTAVIHLSFVLQLTACWRLTTTHTIRSINLLV